MSTDSRPWPKTVIVLGAGASASEGAPLQGDLFREYFRSIRQNQMNVVSEEINSELVAYFKHFWGIDVIRCNLDGVKFPTFEEALGLLEIAESKGEVFRKLSTINTQTSRLREIRKHLINLIGRILEHRLEVWEGHHAMLVSSLKVAGYLFNTTFIGLNYDILIDKAIISESLSDPDYGTDILPEYGGNPVRYGKQKPPLLLKPHGSLNWLHCPSCNQLFYDRYSKSAVPLPREDRSIGCPACQESRTPLIIPPTFFKVMSNLHLQQIWKQAEEELRCAKWIIFCGYSFPDADIHFKYLLKRAEVNRQDHPPRIFIVNSHKGKTKGQVQTERDRYMRFFRRKDRIHWTTLSFQRFSNNPCRIKGFI